MNAAVVNEREIRSRVLREAWELGEPPSGLAELWTDARRELARTLSQLSVEASQRLLDEELDAAEQELTRLESGVSGRGPEAFRTGVELGQRLRWVLWLSDVLSGEVSLDPLSGVEEELDRVETRADDLGRLDKARYGEEAAEIEKRAREERLVMLRARLRRLLEAPESRRTSLPIEEASGRWSSAMETFQLEARFLEGPGGEARTGSDADSNGEARADANQADLARLSRRRAEELDACAKLLEKCSVEEVSQFSREAAAGLLDHVSGELSEGTTSHLRVQLPVLDLLKEQIASYDRVLGPWRERLAQKGVLPDVERRRFLKDSKLLARSTRQVRNSALETLVHQRLVRLMGARQLRYFENFILVSIFAFIGLVTFEFALPEGHPWLGAFAIADLVFCTFFQIDFLLRWGCARLSPSYFLRHFFVESLPALPYGFMFHHLELLKDLEEARAVIVIRLVRLRGVVRLRPLILLLVRVYRILVFFVSGTDRAVERFRPLLDRDVVLFEPATAVDAGESAARRRTLALESRRLRYMRNLHVELPRHERGRCLRMQVASLGMEARVTGGLGLPYPRGLQAERGEINLERVIHVFLDCDVARTITLIGRDGVQRMARWLRFLDLPLLRRAPVVRRLIPSARLPNPTEAVSRATNALGEILQDVLGALRFWGDLSGITTGPQVLDRLASALIYATKRPAFRLLIFGGLCLLAYGLTQLLPLDLLNDVVARLWRFLGIPIVVVGFVCLIVWSSAMWMKRISGEALDVFLRAADAQFYPLLKARKSLRIEDDLETLYRSVLRPEVRLRSDGAVSDEEWAAFLREPFSRGPRFLPRSLPPDDPRFRDFADDREAIALLYEDFLDGPVLHQSDQKTSVQLLGNQVVQDIRSQILGLGARELRKLERLALERRGAVTTGPAFWFRFITESLAIETAKLILEYNTTCIPVETLPLAPPRARARFEAFLAEHRGLPRLAGRRTPTSGAGSKVKLSGSNFTAFDFLGPTETSDEAVRRRFGDAVLEALRRDRRAVIRDVFGTKPYHLLPREQRVFNAYRFYRRYLGGAKFLLLPIVLAFGFLRLCLVGLRQVWGLVQEVLGKRRVLRTHRSRFASFEVAVRKINRMRKPFFMEALRLRASVDLEYLGLEVPGSAREKERDGVMTFRDDLEFVGALETERRPFDVLEERAARDLRQFRIFLEERSWTGAGLDAFLAELDPSGKLLRRRGEVLRALATAYITDYNCLRSVLTAPEWTREFVEAALRSEGPGIGAWFVKFLRCDLLWFRRRVRRRRRLFQKFVARSPETEGLSRGDRRRLLSRLLLEGGEAEHMVGFALRILGEDDKVGEDFVLGTLKDTAREYAVWTRKLVTVRAIQAITVLDIRRYREMVWAVGEYGCDVVEEHGPSATAVGAGSRPGEPHYRSEDHDPDDL